MPFLYFVQDGVLISRRHRKFVEKTSTFSPQQRQNLHCIIDFPLPKAIYTCGR